MESLAVLLLVIALSLVGSGCMREDTDTTTTANNVEFKASKSSYRQGEQISISMIFTNRDKRPCKMSSASEGAVNIISGSRDGVTLEPSFSYATYIDGFRSFILANLTTVQPGTSISLLLHSKHRNNSGGEDLVTSLLDETDEAKLISWPVDKPGQYRVSARYALSALADMPADLCVVSPELTANFTILPAR